MAYMEGGGKKIILTISVVLLVLLSESHTGHAATTMDLKFTLNPLPCTLDQTYSTTTPSYILTPESCNNEVVKNNVSILKTSPYSEMRQLNPQAFTDTLGDQLPLNDTLRPLPHTRDIATAEEVSVLPIVLAGTFVAVISLMIYMVSTARFIQRKNS